VQYSLPMRIFALLLLTLAAALPAQTFTAAGPETIPQADGAVHEPFVLRYIDVKIGDGAPAAAGKEYKVQYTGWLRDGTQFASSRGGEPISFVQGRRMVIAGWEAGFEGMRVGGQRRLFIPYQLGYGEIGQGRLIGPKAELIFDVELLDVREPVVGVAVDVLQPLDEMESRVESLLKAVPEDKLDWRPGPGVRSFREAFLHIAAENQLLMGVATMHPKGDALKKMTDTAEAAEHAKAGKEEILGRLT
jgi:FKBP-type peptidyl-prolyl cis-trans isomerase/DinB superfamily